MAALNPPAAEIGAKAKNFSLKGVDNKTHTLESLKGENGTVIIFMCNLVHLLEPSQKSYLLQLAK